MRAEAWVSSRTLSIMVDRKPPKVIAGEVQTWATLYRFQRDSLLSKLDGIGEADARWSPVPTGTSLIWLVKHCTRAERLWLFDRFAGTEAVARQDDLPSPDSIADVTAAFRDQWPEVLDLVSGHGLDEVVTRVDPGDQPSSLRWIIGHLLEEVARHAGHADIIRELLDGQTGR
jgi:hypothetical protein